jgi:hypothetical protein
MKKLFLLFAFFILCATALISTEGPITPSKDTIPGGGLGVGVPDQGWALLNILPGPGGTLIENYYCSYTASGGCEY